MSQRAIIAIAAVVIAGLAYFAWIKSAERAPQATVESAAPDGAGSGDMSGSMPMMAAPEEDAGLAWNAPSGWEARGPEGVRLATYTVPGTGGGEGAQCAVYYFGPGQGGGVDANLQRWIGEFEDPGQHGTTTLEANGVPISRVEVRGTYMAHSMGTAGSGGKRPDWALLGAIASGPNGDLFFKFTGPAGVVESAAKDFDAMLASIHKP